jgi:hypothetical protein
MPTQFAEFAAGNTSAEIIELRCLELNHPSFDAPIRLVQDYQPRTVKLETGEIVEFMAGNFKTTPPSKDDNGRIERRLEIDNIGNVFFKPIFNLRDSSIPIACIFRSYLSDDLTAPLFVPPEKTTLSEISLTKTLLSARASSADVVNKPFPSKRYTTENTPGLKR